MTKFESLYCLDKKGKIRIFDIKIQEFDGIPVIVSQTGILWGKPTTKQKKILKGKNIGKANETTPYQQAKSEAQSKWNDKLDEGYKSDDMCKEKYTYGFVKCIESGLIRGNTNANWDEKPMLAEPLKKVRAIKYPQFVQPKLNGVRCISKLKDGKVIFMSRGGKYYNMPLLEEYLAPYFEVFPQDILDGELFTKGRSLQEISGVCRGDNKDKSWIQYHVYDMAIPIVSQKGRFTALERLFPYTQDDNSPVQLVETVSANNLEDVMKLHNVWVKDEYEGAIMRDPNSSYLFGFRDKRLIKVKEFIDEEFTLVGCKVTEGKTVGDSFVFELVNNINNLTFFARPKGTREQKEVWYNSQYEWRGKSATVRYQERTDDGLPHQAFVVVIRDYE